jgi:hypothetical protein
VQALSAGRPGPRADGIGDRIAFVDHGLWADNVEAFAEVDLSGEKRTR